MMNGQFYQVLRQDIFNAFTASSNKCNSLLPENLAEGGVSNPVLVTKEVDGKQVITGQYDRVYAVATRPKGSSTCPLHDNAFAHAKIVRAVNRLPENHNAIVMFCYTNRTTEWGFITLIAEYVWAKMELFIEGWQRFKGSALKPEKVQKLKSLAFNAMLHFKEGATNQKKLYTIEILANLLNVSQSNWRRDWGPFWHQLLNIIAELDEQALTLVIRGAKSKVAA